MGAETETVTEAVIDKIFELLQPFNKDNIALTKDTDITVDLHIDSVAVMDLLMVVEDIYNISIPINRLGDMHTIEDLASTVRDTIGST